ncbi:hypothetical protein FHG87_010677 [Trinorchestia longiramus]|nr:hypothetical protein FHG87_010677 [Trinorchestia longiramus]
MSGHAQAAVPSQLPYTMRLQTRHTQTLYQALRKSTSPQKLSSPEQLNSQLRAEQRKQKPAILSVDRMGAQTTYALTRIMRSNYTRSRKMSVRTPVLDDGMCSTKK